MEVGMFFSSTSHLTSPPSRKFGWSWKASSFAFSSQRNACNCIFLLNYNALNSWNSVIWWKHSFKIWMRLQARTNGTTCRKSPRHRITFPPNRSVDRILSLSFRLTAFRLCRCVMTVPSHINKEVLHSSHAGVELTSKEHVFWWWNEIKIVRAECAVLPPHRWWAAITGDGSVSTFSPPDLM